MSTLTELAAFGDKRVGTQAGAKAGDYVFERMHALRLTLVHEESFTFPRFDLASSSLVMTLDGESASIGYDVLEGSGAGHVEADVVDVLTARPDDLAGKDVKGKVVLVAPNAMVPRARQLENVVRAGAAAMLYLSNAPDNLRQIDTVRSRWQPLVALPAVTLGAVDGAAITSALAFGKTVHATLDVKATTTPGTGRNIVGRIEGSDPAAGEIVLGAHYDTWFTGSTDNGGGVAALLALASRRLHKERPAATILFVAYDGEEIAHYGGYDFLRRHRIVGKELITTVINLETPSANAPTLAALARSNNANLDDALRSAQLQGPYSRTTQDTPDKVNLPFLADAVDSFDRAIDALIAMGPACCSAPDPDLWRVDAALRPYAAGASLFVDATVTDSSGAPQANAAADAVLLYDDFFPAAEVHGTTDAAGKITFEIPGEKVALGSGKRYVHVSAGLVEQVLVGP